MEILFGIWVGLVCLCSNVIAQSKYEPRYVSQQVQYDDDQPTYNSHQLKYHPVTSHPSDPYQSHRPYSEPQYHAPANSPYRQPLDNARSYNYYEPPKEQGDYHSSPKPKHASYADLKDPRPAEEVIYVKPKHPEEETALYDSERKTPTHAEQHEELQYSHEPEQPSHHHQEQASPQYPGPSHRQERPSYQHPGSPHHQELPSYQHPGLPHHQEQPAHHQPGSRSSHPAPVPHDPKLPLYFTMYEKRIVQDPLDKYGKGPWRYLTYGHGITYGSKEPGKVFERGYGYIRALGRDHCKDADNLCPPRDDKPFEYDGRKEPYFGYRPH